MQLFCFRRGVEKYIIVVSYYKWLSSSQAQQIFYIQIIFSGYQKVYESCVNQL